jgi:hypothetical protein
MRNNLMALKKMHPEIAPWQMRLLEGARHPEILALFAGLVDFRKAAGRWLTKAIAAVDTDYDNPSGPVRTWFRTQKPTPYEVIKGLLPKPKVQAPAPKKEEAPAPPAPPPAPVETPPAAAEQEPKKKRAPRTKKAKPA